MATASKGDDDSIFKTPALPPPRKAAFSNSLLKPHFAINPVGSPLSLGISAPNTPQSELSDCSYLQLQGVPENSSYFCAASAVDVNVTYQEHLKETLNRIEMNLIENRYRQQEIIEKLLKLELDEEDEPSRRAITANIIKPPFFKSRAYPGGPPLNSEALRIRQEDMQRPLVTNLKRLDWTASDRRLLFNGVKQQCVSMMMKPYIDKQSILAHKLDSLNPYEMDQRRQLAEELNQSEIEMRSLKEKPPKDEIVLGARQRPDIDWVYISMHLFSNQRDPDDCKLHWQNFLHPSVNKDTWSTDESKLLLKTVELHQAKQPFVLTNSEPQSKNSRRHINWKQVAILHGNRRTAFDCFQNYMSKLFSTRGWSQQELRLLRRAVNTFQFQHKISWCKIADLFESRSPVECHDKVRKMTNNSFRQGRWSPDEDLLLLKAVEKHGIGKWMKIRREVPQRTDNQCRERYLFQLSGLYVKESWTKAADETLIDLMLKHGPTNDCAIIAEKTLKKPRKEIYRRFRYLVDSEKQGREVQHRTAVRKAKMTGTAERLREQSMADQVIDMHKNLFSKEAQTEKPSLKRTKPVKKPAPLLSIRTKYMKLGDKLKLLEPDMIDSSFLKSELKKNLPKFIYPPNFHGSTRLEKIENNLDEAIFQRCLPKHSTTFTLSSFLDREVVKEPNDRQMAGLMSQLITMLKIDYLGAWNALKLKSSPEFREAVTSAARERAENKERILNSQLFLNSVRKSIEEGKPIVEECFKEKLDMLYELRNDESVQEMVKEFAANTHSPPKPPEVRTHVVQFPTCVVLPVPTKDAIDDDMLDVELPSADQLDEFEEKTVDELIECLEDEEAGNMNFDIFTSDTEKSPNKRLQILAESLEEQSDNSKQPLFAKVDEIENNNYISDFFRAKYNEFDQDLTVRELIKRFPIKAKSSDTSDDVSRQFFIENYGTGIVPGETNPYIRTIIESNSTFSTIIQGNVIFQLVNVETNAGKRTLAVPLGRLPFNINDGGKSIHLIPEAGNSKVFEVPTFEKMNESKNFVYDLLEKCRSEKSLAKANSLLESAIGPTFITSDEKIKIQEWVKDMKIETNPVYLMVPLISPNWTLLDMWKKLVAQSPNLLCRGLVCYKHARTNRAMMRLARSMFQDNSEPFKYKQAEIAFQLAVYFSKDNCHRTTSTVHRRLYQPIKEVPAMTSMENAWQQALSEDNDKLLKLHANLFERSDRVQSILDEMKATPVYQLFKNRLFALLLFSKAMSETGPRDFGNPNKEVNNNRSKKTTKETLTLFKHFTRKRCNKPKESWFHGIEPGEDQFEVLRRIQRELQSDLSVRDEPLQCNNSSLAPPPAKKSRRKATKKGTPVAPDVVEVPRVVMLNDHLSAKSIQNGVPQSNAFDNQMQIKCEILNVISEYQNSTISSGSSAASGLAAESNSQPESSSNACTTKKRKRDSEGCSNLSSEPVNQSLPTFE
ncbi:uncharacterized protein LOC142340607 isoform X2 [Convolutriloba macropyga]|uniref:uncharacterized protein LOC142340607 isoform X2 n=1 Tax=Convolutriloba macropyga TaxID=536237 RepID=UPI003F525AC1